MLSMSFKSTPRWCGEEPGQEFDEHSAWKPNKRSAWIFHLPGDPGTPEIPANPGDEKIPKTPLFRLDSCNGQEHPEPAKSITLSKNPVFRTDVLCFINLMWAKVMKMKLEDVSRKCSRNCTPHANKHKQVTVRYRGIDVLLEGLEIDLRIRARSSRGKCPQIV